MTAPITDLFFTAPAWLHHIEAYNGLEIHPCREIDFVNGTEIIEVCEPEEAHFFTVYGHRRQGGVEAFEDFDTVLAAREFAARLLAGFANLRHHGLLDCGG